MKERKKKIAFDLGSKKTKIAKLRVARIKFKQKDE